MFGKNNKKEKTQATNSATSTTSNALNSLVQGAVIEGKVVAKSDIRVDGVIKGSLDCTSKVIIGPSGYIEGQIKCTNAIIEGRFEGTLTVQELLNVRKTAKINGEISTNKLIVEAGAIFNVTCRMGKQEPHARTISATREKQVKRTKAS
ncbi:MAG: bactofilin family protein [Saprospiraceae bacterium]